MMKRGKRLAKLCNPPAGAMSDGAACRALIDYIGRLAAHYPRLTTWKSQICFRRRIDDAFAFLELICARVPDLAEDLEDLRDSVGELVAVVGAMMTWPALVIGISTSPCRDGRARIRRDRGYIGQAGPPPKNEKRPVWDFRAVLGKRELSGKHCSLRLQPHRRFKQPGKFRERASACR